MVPLMKPVIVVMGVSGSGKTTLGTRLAQALGVPFEEGDNLHPPANIAKMKAGEPLTDADRAPWLDAVAGWIEGRLLDGRGGVVSCSALKRIYRDRLRRADAAGLRFVLLDPSPEMLRDRLAHRRHHFMPPSLLDSQLATLERPTPDEGVLVLAGTETADTSVAAALTSINEAATA
jgi:gluconokinase